MTRHAIPVDPASDLLVNHAGRPNHHAPPQTPPSHAATGPTVDLVALPNSEDVDPTTPATTRAYLLRAETARQRQLDLLPATDRDVVMAAYRRTVTQVLADIRAALIRVETGLYGICSICDAAISHERLEQRPWATACARCARDDR